MGLGMGGGAPAVDPLIAIPGKVIWLRAALGAARGGYVDGGAAATLFDASGNNNNTTGFNAAGASATYAAAAAQLNSQPAYRLPAGGYTCPSVWPTTGAKFAVAIVAVDSVAAGNQTWSSASAGTHGLKIQTVTVQRVRWNNAATDYTVAALSNGTPVLLAAAYDPGTGYVNAWCQGVWVGQTAWNGVGDASDLAMCDFNAAGQFAGYFGDGMVLNQYPTAAQIQTICQAYNATYAYAPAGNSVLIFGGASLNTDVDSGTNYEQILLASLTGAVTSYDVSQAGASIETTISTLATKELSKITLTKNCIVGGILGARASMDPGGQGDTAAQAYASLQTYCARVRTAGAKVVVYTAPMANSAGAADMSTVLTSYNTLVRAGYASFADGLIDLAADSRFGTPGCQSNSTYYQADGIHPTHAACVIWAAIGAPVIQALL